MTGYIANTDRGWFDFLRLQPPQEEVNFWSPSAHSVFRGPVGSPFFFKLKSPDNAIGGYGVVSWADRMPEWLAWECFGQGNGAPNLVAMQAQIERLRKSSDIQGRESLDQIGCIILSRPVFFPPELWIPQPIDWKKNNLRYAGYDLATGEGARVWRECQLRVEGLTAVLEADRYGQPVLIAPRLGQGTFRLAVTKAYGGACAMTGEHSLPVLEAAHIKAYGADGEHEVRNGILLRSDVHKLFDRGYMTVTPEHRVEVSRQFKEHFSNGKSYYPLHGAAVALPQRQVDLPDAAFLQWHNEHVFRA
ncbi:MAG: HNH endonuclease [Acidobacteria bacterium]|nr:HNH endonuclease [Acidobacteriota bacterium]